MWISVLLQQKAEGFRVPGIQAAVRGSDEVIERHDWVDQADDDVFTISNAIDRSDAEKLYSLRNDSIDFETGMKDKRHPPSRCGCVSEIITYEFGAIDILHGTITYPERHHGRKCVESDVNNRVCKLRYSCTTITNKMHFLKYKAGHNRNSSISIHHSIKHDFYWEAFVS